jgi:hypothetical protein
MNIIKVYRVASFILLPVGILLGLIAVIGLVVGLGNFAILLPAFICGATVVYIFASFSFLQKVVERQAVCKRSFKDVIKVNAFVALFFACLTLLNSILILFDPDATKLLLESMATMQQNLPQKTDPRLFTGMLKGVTTFMIIISLLIIFHTRISFRLLKQYEAYFKL